jgi:hypothetical protein
MLQYQHHQDTLDLYVRRHAGEEGLLAIVLAGSVAKGAARPDSDVDLLICLTDEGYAQMEREGRTTECVTEERFYKGGYYDIKYCTKEYLKACADHGSEPARNAYQSARVVYARDAEIEDLVRRIPVFQKGEQAEKLFSFYSTLELSHAYYWTCCVSGQDNPYLRVRTAADLVLCGLRLFLQEREVLFPCQRRLVETVRQQPGGAPLADTADRFLRALGDEEEAALMRAVQAAVRYRPTQSREEIGARHIDDVELWWYKNRPNLTEW